MDANRGGGAPRDPSPWARRGEAGRPRGFGVRGMLGTGASGDPGGGGAGVLEPNSGKGGSREARAGKGASRHGSGGGGIPWVPQGMGLGGPGGAWEAGGGCGFRGPSGCRGRECPGVPRGPGVGSPEGWGQGPRSLQKARLGVASGRGRLRAGVPSGWGGGVPGIPPEAGAVAPQDTRPPSYLCRAPHRRSRAARTRARRRRGRRAASGAAAAAAPGGRACCSRAAEGEPGRACSRRSPSAASWAAAAAWASATTSRASWAAAPSRRLAAPSRRPPRAGPHEAGGGLSGPELEQRQRRGGADGAGGGAEAGPEPPGTVAKDRLARAPSPTPWSGSRGGAGARRERR